MGAMPRGVAVVTAALAWLRARWHGLVVSVSLLVIALVWARRQGRTAERARTTAANRDAIGAELRADDALDERDRERAQLEAEAKARLEADTRERLTRPPRTMADARREARERAERLARAEADE